MDARRREAIAPQITPGMPDAPSGDPVTAGLRQMFDVIAQEPIPDDFLRLLDEIDARASEIPRAGTAMRSAPGVGDAGGDPAGYVGGQDRASKPGAMR